MSEPEVDLRRRLDGVLGRAVHGLAEPGAPASPSPGSIPAAGPLREEEVRLLDTIETYLDRGRDLSRWWNTVFPDGFRERFDLSRSYDRADRSFGFFDEAPVDGRPMPVMGNYQLMFYDDPKPYANSTPAGRGEWIQQQMREFVLRYFMRVSDFREPEVAASTEGGTPPAWLRPWSLCRPKREQEIGFGFSQLYFKTLDGEIGRFEPEDRFAIVDLREIGRRYAWIVVKVRIFDFSFSYQPFGETGPRFTLPLAEESYLALSSDFITDRPPGDGPHAEEPGRYGIGYAFVRDPEPGVLGYGPGEFEAAIERIDFRVDPAGRVRVGMVFVSNRPEQIVNLSLDPAEWGTRLVEIANGGRLPGWMRPIDALARLSPFRRLKFDPVYGGIDAANFLSGGLARRLLCVSRRTLEEEFLIKHFEQHYQTVATSLHTWRQVPDWLDRSAVPEWARRGF